MNNPKDMIQLQNTLWKNRLQWSNQEIPQSSWSGDPASPSQRVYWGWNEVPVDRSVMDDSQNWDAVFIKLPSAICGGGAADSVNFLSAGAKQDLENNLAVFIKDGLLKPGLQNAKARPGSAVVFLKEEPDSGGWKRTFYCEHFAGPQGKWDVVYDKSHDLCYIQAAALPPPPPTPPRIRWKKHKDTNCYQNHGATDLESPVGSSCGSMTLQGCKNYCLTHPAQGGKCTAIAFDDSNGNCYRRANVDLSRCEHTSTFELLIADNSITNSTGTAGGVESS